MQTGDELERLAKVRQLKDEPRELYLCRVARALTAKHQAAAESLKPKAYAWMKDAQARLLSGGYPLEFDDDSIEVSVSEQLVDLLEVEDEVYLKKTAPRHGKLRKPTKETRTADNLRIAQYLLLYPSVSDIAAADELSSTGWLVTKHKVERVRAEMRRALYALKESGFTVHGPDGARIIAI